MRVNPIAMPKRHQVLWIVGIATFAHYFWRSLDEKRVAFPLSDWIRGK